MKRAVSCILAAVLLVGLFSISAFGASSKNSAYIGIYRFTAGTDNADPDNSGTDSNVDVLIRKDEIFLKFLYREFLEANKEEDFTKEELKERFEDYLKERHINPDQIKNYDDLIEGCIEAYEDMDPDEYDFFADFDVDGLADGYLNDFSDYIFFEDYAKYLDEIYDEIYED